MKFDEIHESMKSNTWETMEAAENPNSSSSTTKTDLSMKSPYWDLQH